GGPGADTVREQGNVDFTLDDGLLTFGPDTDLLYDVDAADLTGGEGNNFFDVSGWTGTGSVNGQGGSDTLTGPDGRNTWTLTSGGGQDFFVPYGTAVLTGHFDGGTSATLDYSNYTGDVNVIIGGPGSEDGVTGTGSGVAPGGSFTNINVLVGSTPATPAVTT